MTNWKLNVYKCITGEHQDKLFVHFSEGAYRLIENGRINRYPYFTFEQNEVEFTNTEIEEVFNLQVKFDCEKYKELTRNKELARKALVVAYRIIQHNKQFDQFKIEYSCHWDEKQPYDYVSVYHTQYGGIEGSIAEIGFEIDGTDVFVFCEKLHRKKTVYGMRIDYDMFDHKKLGVKYKKEIDLNELKELKEIIRG